MTIETIIDGIADTPAVRKNPITRFIAGLIHFGGYNPLWFHLHQDVGDALVCVMYDPDPHSRIPDEIRLGGLDYLSQVEAIVGAVRKHYSNYRP